MGLTRRRWREANEDYDAITPRILSDGVDVEIGFPIVNEPNIAALIYIDLGANALLG